MVTRAVERASTEIAESGVSVGVPESLDVLASMRAPESLCSAASTLESAGDALSISERASVADASRSTSVLSTHAPSTKHKDVSQAGAFISVQDI